MALFTIHCSLFTVNAQNNRTYNQMTEDGSITTRTDNSRNFSSHNNDTTKKHKEIPKGIYVWTIDKTLGDVIPAEPDTCCKSFDRYILKSNMNIILYV